MKIELKEAAPGWTPVTITIKLESLREEEVLRTISLMDLTTPEAVEARHGPGAASAAREILGALYWPLRNRFIARSSVGAQEV